MERLQQQRRACAEIPRARDAVSSGTEKGTKALRKKGATTLLGAEWRQAATSQESWLAGWLASGLTG